MIIQGPYPVFGQPAKGVTYTDRPGAYALMYNEAGEMALVETSTGLFLPGGGLEPGETHEQALNRELMEEIGHREIQLRAYAEAHQFHWSEFYQQHFKKIGKFFLVETKPPPQETSQAGHGLLWKDPKIAAKTLSQEFQRWAVNESLKI